MIKNYIFDFGNVLCEFSPDKLSSLYIDDAEARKRISNVVFDRLYWDKLDRGTITDEEVKKGIISRLEGKEAETGCKIYDNWVNNLTPIKGMEALIGRLSDMGKKLYLLSNISIGFAETYRDVPWISELLEKFDGLVLSGIIGKTKPGKEIFEYLVNEYALNKEESIFIDDSPVNIKGAEDFGIKGYLFDGDCLKLEDFLTCNNF